MTKMEYEAPEMEILEFETQDCITASVDVSDYDKLMLGLFD